MRTTVYQTETNYYVFFLAIFILGKIVVIRCTFEIVIAALLIHGARKVQIDKMTLENMDIRI